jgi:hypothetical protein
MLLHRADFIVSSKHVQLQQMTLGEWWTMPPPLGHVAESKVTAREEQQKNGKRHPLEYDVVNSGLFISRPSDYELVIC